MATFDEGELALINFPELLIMLTRQPWRELLPEHLAWAGQGTPSQGWEGARGTPSPLGIWGGAGGTPSQPTPGPSLYTPQLASPLPPCPSPSPQPPAPGPQQQAHQMLKVADAILGEARRLFDSADSNQDGLVADTELRDLVSALWTGLDPEASPVPMGLLNREAPWG